MTSKSLSAWVTWNWTRIVGLPSPDAGPWMLSDTPLSLSALRHLSVKGVIEKVERNAFRVKDDGRVTKQVLWSTDAHKWERVLDQNRVDAELMRTFAADPLADVYVVDVLPTIETTRDMWAAQEVLDAEIQSVAVAECPVAEYPGTVLVQDDVSEVLPYIPDVDVLLSSPRLPRWPLALEIEGPTLLNPGPGDVFDVIEAAVGIADECCGVVHGERQAASDGQRVLFEWDPTKLTEREVEPDVESGQASLDMLG